MERKMELCRRHLLGTGVLGGAASLAAGFSQPPAAKTLPAFDPASSQDHLRSYVRMVGSTKRETVFAHFSGILWGLMPKRMPTQLCGFSGLARIDWTPMEDGSFLRQTFDVGMFTDLNSGARLDELHNPFTGQTNQPHHFMYGGGQERLSVTGIRAPSEPEPASAPPLHFDWEVKSPNVLLNEVRNGSFPHPIPRSEWPLASTGSEYHYGAEYTYVSPVEQLANPSLASVDYTLFWSSVTSWEAWMLMGNLPGFNLWRATGNKVRDLEDVPPALMKHVYSTQPNFLDDGMPWEGVRTSAKSFMFSRTPSIGRKQ